MGAVVKLNRSIRNMKKLASLILFASVLTTVNFQELRATNFGQVLEKNEKTSGVTISGKPTRGSTLVSGGHWGT
jgi:hypothetical protein